MSDVRNKSLEELEGENWGEPNYPSHLVTTCHRLRRVPIGQLSVEDLRILLGQSIGVKYLVPLSLEILRRDPLAEGDYYPGDLLCSVLRLEANVWSEHPEWVNAVNSIVETMKEIPTEIRDTLEIFKSRKA
jgi:hypothetical protein